MERDTQSTPSHHAAVATRPDIRPLEPGPDLRHGPAMFRILIRVTVWLFRASLRSRDDLVLENLALRQQLAICAARIAKRAPGYRDPVP